MKWREPTPVTGAVSCGTKHRGGSCWRAENGDWDYVAWLSDAVSDNSRTYKTLKAAQHAVERWLEKHG